MCSLAAVSKSASRELPASAEVSTAPLRILSTANISQGDYLAWHEPALCDDQQNVYFLVVPHLGPRDMQGGTNAAAGVLSPSNVLRISADGKTRTTFNPASSSKFASAKELATHAIALDKNGTLFMLIWVRWGDRGGPGEKSGQYIVSFDEKGKYQSHQEVDWQEMLVHQLEAFGSGEFLLRGQRADPPEPRLAILSAAGLTLRDVVGWSNDLLEEPSHTSTLRFDSMVRGDDGRIYVTQQAAKQHEEVVYALRSSGEIQEVFKLRPMPRDAQLLGLKTAGDRFAAAYLEAEQQSEASPGAMSGRWWIAVYSNVAGGGESQTTVYGPAPGSPLCYQHSESGDRFTFLTGGNKLVTMSP